MFPGCLQDFSSTVFWSTKLSIIFGLWCLQIDGLFIYGGGWKEKSERKRKWKVNVEIFTLYSDSSTEPVPSIAQRVTILRHPVNLLLYNWRVPALLEISSERLLHVSDLTLAFQEGRRVTRLCHQRIKWEQWRQNRTRDMKEQHKVLILIAHE